MTVKMCHMRFDGWLGSEIVRKNNAAALPYWTLPAPGKNVRSGGATRQWSIRIADVERLALLGDELAATTVEEMEQLMSQSGNGAV